MEPKRNYEQPAAILFWVLIWQLGAVLANRRLLIPLPTPVTTLQALLRLVQQQSFWSGIGGSMLRICLGFAAALLVGTLCAVLSASVRPFRVLTMPLVQLIRAVPVTSLTIVIFLWVSREQIPSVISFLTVLPIVWANVETGLLSADRGLAEMAQVFGMKRSEILGRVILPELRPFFLSAAAGGMGFAWKSGIAAEIICRTASSIGNLLWAGKNAVEYDEVFAVTLVIVLLSSLLQLATRSLLKGSAGR